MSALDDDRRIHLARLAQVRQEIEAPVLAIVGYAEILHEEAIRAGLGTAVPDLDRILMAARALAATVDRLLDRDVVRELFLGRNDGDALRKLRHDLRTPINAVKGYTEMLLEDLDDLGAGGLRSDFTALLGETRRLLAQLETIADFSGSSSVPVTVASAMSAELVRSLRPLDAPAPVAAGRILVVDDIAANRDLLARRLERDGHRPTLAAGGEEALRLATAGDFDLVLLDLMMPDVNGFEVLARLKGDTRLRDIPVIMISALDEMESVVRCIEAGADDYLPKPFDPVLLKARISACLEKKQWHELERLYRERMEAEKEKYEQLLMNILPRQIVERLNHGESTIADRFDNVSVLFCDLVGFARISARLPPVRLVEYLNVLFSTFDAHARELGVEKIKMIGDAYMVVAGLPERRTDHAEAIARMGLRMAETIEQGNRDLTVPFKARIGIHSGPVVGGIIGTHRFVYDIWGDTVNVASRLQQSSLANRIQISEATAKLLSDRFEVAPRGMLNIKGIGKMRTFFLSGESQGPVGVATPFQSMSNVAPD